MKPLDFVKEKKLDYLLAVGSRFIINDSKYIAVAALYEDFDHTLEQNYQRSIVSWCNFNASFARLQASAVINRKK